MSPYRMQNELLAYGGGRHGVGVTIVTVIVVVLVIGGVINGVIKSSRK